MKTLFLLPSVLTLFLLTSCGKKQLQAELDTKNAQIEQLQKQIDQMQSTTGSLLERMEDLSVVNKEGAQSIKNSLETITRQYGFIQNLTEKIQSKDSLNLALVMNLKRSLTDVNDEDVHVEIREGVVYVSDLGQDKILI